MSANYDFAKAENLPLNRAKVERGNAKYRLLRRLLHRFYPEVSKELSLEMLNATTDELELISVKVLDPNLTKGDIFNLLKGIDNGSDGFEDNG